MKKIIKEKNVILITVLVLILLSVIKKVYVFEFKYEAKNNIKIRGMILQKEKVTEDKVSYLIKYDNNKFLLNIYEPKLKDNCYKYGDIIEFRGSINKIEKLNNPYEFDYKKYLNSNNIVTTITCKNEIKYICSTNGNLIFKVCYILKEGINDIVDKKIPKVEANLYKSMIYGEDLYLDEDIKESFKKNGMSHLLAVSGLHLMYLISIIDIVLKKSNIRNCKVIYYIIIICYIIVSGMSISSLRAGIMSILLISGKENDENEESVDNLKIKYINIAISYIILIIYNPYIIFNVSGILSYLATIGIVTFNSVIYSFFEIILKVPKCTLGIFKILSPTFASLLMLFPVQIYYFGVLELRLIISCIITNFLISFIYLLGFIALFFSFIPFVSDILFNSLFVLIHILIKISSLISTIPVPTIFLPKPSVFELYFYYLSILFLVLKKYLSLISTKRIRNILKNTISIFVVLSFCLIILLCIYRIYFEEYVVYFNVGQGNMSVIRKNRRVIVIDCGSTQDNLASNTLNNFLLAKGIKEIDLLILTHMHTDHINGIYGINADIKKVGYSIPKEECKEYNNLLDYLDKNNISKMELKKDDKITLKDITIEILLPYNDKVIQSNDVANSNSIVCMINLKERKKDINLLYMGDSTIETENELFKNIDKGLEEKLENISILQAGHHGSKTSSSENFLNYLNINLAIISSKKKVYGHPSKETLDNLNKYNIRYKITENDGAVLVKL